MRQNHTTLTDMSSARVNHLANPNWEYRSLKNDNLTAFAARQHDRVKRQIALGQRVIKC